MSATIATRLKVAVAVPALGAGIFAASFTPSQPAVAAPAHVAAVRAQVSSSAIDSYVNSHLGAKVGTGQCVSLAIHFGIDVYGLPSTGWGGDAWAWAPGGGGSANLLASHGFTWHTDGNYQNGDIMVYGKASNMRLGHVAIWYNGQAFEENWNHVQAAQLHSLAGRRAPQGYWRAPGGSTPPPPAPTDPCNPVPSGWSWWEPSKDVQLAIQAELKHDNVYHGPVNGIWGPNTRKGIQTEIQKAGYTGPVDGVPGAHTACYVQKFAAEHGGYTGPINAIPKVNSWNGFLAALRNT